MDEITLTRELGRGASLPSPARLASARARLLDELTAASASSQQETRVPLSETPVQRLPRQRATPRHLTRWALALAAAVTGVVAVAATSIRDPQPDSRADAMVPVAQFLDTVAAVAAEDEDVVPRGDQFVYSKAVGPDKVSSESWNSVDGVHDSVGRSSDGREDILPGCVNGRQKGSDSAGNAVQVECDVQPHFLPDLPTDPTALVAWLAKRNPDENGKPMNVNGVGKDLWTLADGYWLRPAQRAALYRAVGMIDGISLVPNSKDGSGRSGTGVAWISPNTSTPEVQWIFDEQTHVLLGTPNYSVVTLPHIVDKVGQRP